MCFRQGCVKHTHDSQHEGEGKVVELGGVIPPSRGARGGVTGCRHIKSTPRTPSRGEFTLDQSVKEGNSFCASCSLFQKD